MATARFTALQCDDRLNRFMKACDLMDGVGQKVIISFDTDTPITDEYMANMAKHIESMPPQNGIVFRCVKPL